MSVFHHLIYRVSQIPVKIPVYIFAEADKIIIKFIWVFKGYKMAKMILRMKKEIWRIHTPQLQNLL